MVTRSGNFAAIRNLLRNSRRALPFPTRRNLAIDLRAQGALPLQALYESRFEPCVIRVPIAATRWWGPTGFRYGAGSTHPYVLAVEEYAGGRNPSYEGSALSRYWTAWQPGSLAAALGLSGPDIHPKLASAPPVHSILPWFGSDCLMTADLASYKPRWQAYYLEGYSLTRSNGPQSIEFGKQRLAHIIKTYEFLKSRGVWSTPPSGLSFFEQFPVGDILESDGRVALMMADGQHRLAAMSALGMQEANVIVAVRHGRGPMVVRRSDVDTWPLVRMGVMTPGQALEVFDRIFRAEQPAGCVWPDALSTTTSMDSNGGDGGIRTLDTDYLRITV